MKTKQILALTVLVLVACSLAILGGCKKKEEPTPPEGDLVTYANTKCPIMGSVIKPEKVTTALTKDFKGSKVALCCAACPAKWDKLSDEDKATKLADAK